MGFYSRHILPRLIDCGCGTKPVLKQREKVVPLASGIVLEIGIGTGHNLPYYDAEKVERLIGLDPCEDSWKLAAARASALDLPIEFVALPGEQIPLDTDSVDTVLVTYSLCTIPDPVAALHGMHRVLKPSGQLIFCEHGVAPDAPVRKWQNRLNGFWGAFTGGCNINRDIPALLAQGGFEVDVLDEMYLPGTPRIAGYNFWGSAHPGVAVGAIA